MIDLSLHLLDLLQNCAHAQATRVTVRVVVDGGSDRLLVTVEDNGRGMAEEEIRRALDPFYTTEQGKRVGLGLPFVAQAAKTAGGDIKVSSAPGRGTKVEIAFGLAHLDRQPLGDLASTIVSFMAGNSEIETRLCYRGAEGAFDFVSSQLVSERERRAIGQIAFLCLAEKTLRDELAKAGFRPDRGGAVG